MAILTGMSCNSSAVKKREVEKGKVMIVVNYLNVLLL